MRSLRALVAVLVVLGLGGAATVYARMESSAAAQDPVQNPNKVDVSLLPGEELRVTFVGDSLTYGLYATEPARTFREQMVADWRGEGPVGENPYALAGGTTIDALGNPDFPRDQHLYVVELGTNDAVQISHRAFRHNYDELLGRIRASSPNAGLLCVGLWRPRDVASRFDTIIKDLCEVRGGQFRSISDLAEDEHLRGPADTSTFAGPADTFHPNDLGHSAIARRLVDAVVVNREN